MRKSDSASAIGLLVYSVHFQPALLSLKGNTTESQLLLVKLEHLVSRHLLSKNEVGLAS